jgi:hypothetical protein
MIRGVVMNNEKILSSKKRGRKPKNQISEYVLNKDRSKFFVDLSCEKVELDLIFGLLERANQKDYGREITFKDLALFSVTKMTDKDLEKIQESTLSDMEKVERALMEFNKKNNSNMTLGEFLVKKLSIN